MTPDQRDKLKAKLKSAVLISALAGLTPTQFLDLMLEALVEVDVVTREAIDKLKAMKNG